MTDRAKGLTVTLKEDIRVDDLQHIANAISMIKGVLHVEPVIATADDHFIRQRVESEYKEKLIDIIKN